MKKHEKEVVVVGVGASAGGLEALQAFVKNLPFNTNLAYIVAQHLSPTYKSLMVALLTKDTEHQVAEAKNGLVIKPDTIYICPPNKNITIQKNLIVLSEIKQGLYGPKPSVDLFFESIAEEKKDKGIGIILSGTGSDGTRGVRAINAEGGFIVAQDPKTAKYDGMPNSAVNTGKVDLILKAEDIGPELLEILSYPRKPVVQGALDKSTSIYTNILTKLKEIKGIDFNEYKPSTIQRRIERRMTAMKTANLEDYYAFLAQNVEEVEALFQDILIGVTSFFRDSEAFDELKINLQNYLKQKEDNTIRIWAPGSSTGEEAYSIGIVLSDILGSDIGKYKIQIFATDIDEEALHLARKGIYPESALVEMDKKLRNKYFLVKTEHYEVIKPIREMIIFSRHDINKDPGFLRLDLIVCRNLLIYFSQELQKRLFPMFHYSLHDHGLIFLGKSESVGHYQTYFKTVDKKWKIYQAKYLGRKEPPQTIQLSERNDMLSASRIVHQAKKPSIQDNLSEYINKYILPMCIVINDSMDIVFVKGKNPYLIRPDGEQTQNIFRNVQPALSIELRSAIHNSIKDKNVFKSNFQKIILFGEVIRYVRIVVMPMDTDPNNNGMSLICFQEETGENFKSFDVNTINDENERTKEIELELARTKEHLQTVIEELETSNEEMQSLNEELQSSNEELQSSNEELETTNEELQSTNEELQTAYTEMRAMYEEKEEHANQLASITEEFEKSNNRLNAALDGIKMGIYDHHIPIQKQDYWNDIWAEVFGYRMGELPSDKTNMYGWIEERIHPNDKNLINELRESFIRGECQQYNVKCRMRHKKGHWIWIDNFAIPVESNEDGQVTRIIGTIRDISADIETNRELKNIAEKLKNAQKIASLGNWEWDIQEKQLLWSDEVYEIFGQTDQSFGKTYEEFIQLVYEEDRGYVKQSVDLALQKKSAYDIHHRINHPNKGILYVREIGSVVYDENNNATKMIGIVQDETQQKILEYEIIRANRSLDLSQSVSKIGSWDWNVRDDQLWWSEQMKCLFGYEQDALFEASYDSFINKVHADDREFVRQQVELAFNNKKSYNCNYRVIPNPKKTIIINSVGKVYFDDTDNPIRMVGIAQDVTEKINAQLILKENQERLKLATHSAKIGLWELMSATGVAYWDERSYEIFGIQPGTKVTYEIWHKLLHPDDAEKVHKEITAAIAEKRFYNVVFRIIRPDGQIYHIQGTGNPIFEGDEFIKIVGTNIDLTKHLSSFYGTPN